jgi:hypothetical protein
MIRRSLELLLACPLFACASTPDVASAPKPEDFDVFSYRVEVPSDPAGTAEVALRVATTEAVPTALSIRGLVGNAPFEVPPLDGETSFANEQVELAFVSVGRSARTTWELQAATRGKPLELDIRVGFPKGSTDVAALERALDACTTATRDGKPIEAATRLVRVR